MTAIKLWQLLAFFTNVLRCQSEMEGLIVGGEYGDIADFPHAVCLNAYCDSDSKMFWVCGSTVLNQRILLTAAHCVDECKNNHQIMARAGSSNTKQALQKRLIARIKVHEDYDKSTLFYDVALLFVNRDFELGDTIKRATIGRSFPTSSKAVIAGWGVVNEKHQPTVRLKFVKQTVWKIMQCLKYSGLMAGSFCASSGTRYNYPFAGDSGSGLVIQPAGTAQVIGLVSYRVDEKPELTYYTNVSFHRKWIKKESEKLFCDKVI